MLGYALLILDLVLLVCGWVMGDAEFRTKVIFTVIFLLIVGWTFVESLSGMIAQGCLAGILWWLTFGSRGR